MRAIILTLFCFSSCALGGAMMVAMPWWGVVLSAGVWGTGLLWLGLSTGWAIALRMPRKDVMQLLGPSVLKRFDELTTDMMKAVAEVVGDRVINEAFPITIPDDYVEAAKKRASQIAGEEVARVRAASQDAIREGMPM